ncbi:hypothetical protein [Ahrensia sp. R2A130]|uniref:hypothetical protein n=1 Tax=Ahrensia sp. R2A130 TaxID=744979 RepID=UPI0001E0AC67|nr:hypothetical protein [Ahrensia sp. R2A130]EFL90684.1 NADH dehydrogenase subunit 6 [Ahrensia sp. R2A130]
MSNETDGLSMKVMANGWYGLSFGLLIGLLMRAPGADAVEPAFAINLCVMAALWLGIAIGNPTSKSRAYADIAAATATFVLAAVALRTEPMLMIAGFLFQTWWSLEHRSARWGVIGPVWFLIFASMANLGFAIALLALLTVF